MGFGVLFGLLMIVSGWWLYSRWAALRERDAQRREAEMMLVFEARSMRPAADAPTSASGSASAASDFVQTRPGAR
jgi:hypothetical protein